MKRKIPVKIKVRELNFGYLFILTDEENNSSIYISHKNFDDALNPSKSVGTLKVQLSKTGNTDFEIVKTGPSKLSTRPFFHISCFCLPPDS